MTKTLIDRIREAGKFDEARAINESKPHSFRTEPAWFYTILDRQREHAQSAWMCEALLVAVKQLEFQGGISDHKALREIAALVPKGEK